VTDDARKIPPWLKYAAVRDDATGGIDCKMETGSRWLLLEALYPPLPARRSQLAAPRRYNAFNVGNWESSGQLR